MHQKVENKIDVKQAKYLLKTHYGVEGVLTPLPGEVDLNFKVKVADENKFVLKISPANGDKSYLDFQEKILLHLKNSPAPDLIKNLKGYFTTKFDNKTGETRYIRLISWTSGRVWSTVNPITTSLRGSLGQCCGEITERLKSFDHKYAHRLFEWDLAQSLWVESHLSLFDDEQISLLNPFLVSFKKIQNQYQILRKSLVHNDANDNNIIVTNVTINPFVNSLIDYGDAINTQIINDVAICCAYAIIEVNDPLEAAIPVIKGYHSKFPLYEKELEFLYILIAMRLIVSVTKAAINKVKSPLNEYLLISERSAWKLIRKWSKISEEFAFYRFREACGLEPHPKFHLFYDWSKSKTTSPRELFPSLEITEVHHLDLSVSSSWLGLKEEFNNLDLFKFKIKQLQKQKPKKILAGGYLEPRSLYTSESYNKVGNNGLEKRCIHLGIDFWVPKYTPVHSPYNGTIVKVFNDQGEKAYGGTMILKHDTKSFTFYTLYGHLALESIQKVGVGSKILKGDFLAFIGSSSENGNWAPHLHFQIMLSQLDYKNDFPGVCYYNHIKTWKSICPDPNFIFQNESLKIKQKNPADLILSDRLKSLGKGMSLQYKEPLHIVRGEKEYLIDRNGRHFLDMVNNVSHVGHEHPKVVMAGQAQMSQLNTNSRYLHENITRLAKHLITTLPPELSIIHFVNSGSEANELALRMVKTITGSNQIIASKQGYHGNTNRCIDVSSYKFDGRGGNGKPSSTHIFPIPDSFRGMYRGDKTVSLYVAEVKKIIESLKKEKKVLGGMIIEPIISCGGQIELPKGFLKETFDEVRKADGICIVDEVQTGCGRVGSHFWGFQLHDVIPDIITIGKPLGNGHPIAAVACTQKVAEGFNNGMEFFNTFGGNPVSCAIAKTVLEVIEDEKLQENSLVVGNFLKTNLLELSSKYSIIGSVRGQGLFLGVEFVNKQLQPLAEQADYFINRMKSYGILLSTDGPDHNVIKIKPPLVFSMQNAKDFLKYFTLVLQEDLMQLN